MAKIKRIVTSEVEGRNLSDFYGDNSYSFENNGTVNYYGTDKMGPVIGPGIVYGSNADSGDGYGNNTIKLVPHAPNGDINDDRYLIIDPTVPNHIHIRAGGQQDNSNAELILGAEKAQVKVTDYNHQVGIQSWDAGNDIYRNWQFSNDGTLYGPGDSGNIKLTGIQNADFTNYLEIKSSGSMTVNALGGDMNFYMDGAAYIGPSDSENRIAQIKDLIDYTSPTATQWSPVFQADGLTFTGSGTTYPTYNSYYIKFGQMVTFNIAIDLSTVTNFGTGQFKTALPFAPIPSAANHFSAWAWVDPTQPADGLNGHIQMVADHLPNSQVLDLHWLKETTAEPKPLIESILSQGNPITFTTASKIYINGTYICQ